MSRHDGDYKADLKLDVPAFDQSFDVVVHAAGKAHMVPRSEEESKDFYDTNVQGTQNLLTALEAALPKAFIFISSVAVYGADMGQDIAEDAPLLAKDPYGKSKIDAELLVTNWCEKNKVICTVLRLPLLAGPNPPGNLASMIKGMQAGYYFNIAGGKAKKSVVLAEDVAKIIDKVSTLGGVYNLTDRYHPSFLELSALISRQLGKPAPRNIPNYIGVLMAKVGDLLGSRSPINTDKLKKITADLTFNDDKAVAAFEWKPLPVLQGFNIKEEAS